ncbi:EF-hand domain-containing protein [Verrucomicrobiales bacterium]|nr:EF-hand domain-containing protein [Verrucomicrobiales bacterium]
MQPVTISERLAHVRAAKQKLGTKIPWLADTMENDLKHAFGDRNNSEFVISPKGKVLIARAWSDPEALRTDLEELVGKSGTLTKVSDLDRPESESHSNHSKVATGIVPRIERPSDSGALTVKAIPSGKDLPLYLKLRAEAPSSLNRDGSGTMHLSFSLDPIHRTHWNNLAPAMKYSITSSKGMTFTPPSGEGAKVTAADADRDPRDFLVEVELGDSRESARVSVSYFACDDDDRWCNAITQEFEISWETDRDAGRIQDRSKGSKGKGMKGKSGRGMPNPEQLISRLDTNEDGIIQKEEVSGQMAGRFDQMDEDKSGTLSREELSAWFEKRGR